MVVHHLRERERYKETDRYKVIYQVYISRIDDA